MMLYALFQDFYYTPTNKVIYTYVILRQAFLAYACTLFVRVLRLQW